MKLSYITLISSLFILSSCSVFDLFSLQNNPWQKEEQTLPTQNICPNAPRILKYFSENEALDNQFTQFQSSQSKSLNSFSREVIAFSVIHALASPHLFSESSNISTIIKYKGKLYSNTFNNSNSINLSNYIFFISKTLEEKSTDLFIKSLNQYLPRNLFVSKSLESHIEKNKATLIKDDNYAKLFFRGISPLKEGESFTRDQFKLSKNRSETFENSPLTMAPNKYLCNFKQLNKTKTKTNTSVSIGSETFGIFQDQDNYFVTTVSSLPNLDFRLSKTNLGTNNKTPIATAICLNDTFLTISKDDHFAREILTENFLNLEETKDIDPTLLYPKKRKLNLNYPPRMISEIYAEDKVQQDTKLKIYWLNTLGNIEILNLENSKYFYDPRKGNKKCN